MSDQARTCVCGHFRVAHSYDRAEDYACEIPGCTCGGFEDARKPDPEPSAQEIKIKDLSRVQLEPGDVLVLRLEEPVAPEVAKAMRLALAEAFPRHRAVVLDQGADLSVVRASDA